MVIGPLAAAIAVASVVLAFDRPSGVERRLRRAGLGARDARSFVRVVARVVAVPPEDGRRGEAIATSKVAFGLAGALVGCVIAALTSSGPIAPAVVAYLGFVIPSVVVSRREARERQEAERATIAVIEWLHAIVASGRPLEAAVERVTLQSSGSVALDRCLAAVRRDYTLGVPMHVALARNGAEARIRAVTELAERVERSRDLGRGVLGLLQDLRDELRASERADALEAASHVEGKLTLVLTLCYLPALALLVIIPLFLTLLSGLFGT